MRTRRIRKYLLCSIIIIVALLLIALKFVRLKQNIELYPNLYHRVFIEDKSVLINLYDKDLIQNSQLDGITKFYRYFKKNNKFTEFYIFTQKLNGIEQDGRDLQIDNSYTNIYVFDVRNKQTHQVTNFKYSDLGANIGYKLSLTTPVILKNDELWIVYSIVFYDSAKLIQDIDFELSRNEWDLDAYKQYYLEEYNGIKSGIYMINYQTSETKLIKEDIIWMPSFKDIDFLNNKFQCNKAYYIEDDEIKYINPYVKDFKVETNTVFTMPEGYSYIYASPDCKHVVYATASKIAGAPIKILNMKGELKGMLPAGEQYGAVTENGLEIIEDKTYGKYDQYRRTKAKISPDDKYVMYIREWADPDNLRIEFNKNMKGIKALEEEDYYDLIIYPIDKINKETDVKEEMKYTVLNKIENLDIFYYQWIDEDHIMYTINTEDGKHDYRIMNINTKETGPLIKDLQAGEYDVSITIY